MKSHAPGPHSKAGHAINALCAIVAESTIQTNLQRPSNPPHLWVHSCQFREKDLIFRFSNAKTELGRVNGLQRVMVED